MSWLSREPAPSYSSPFFADCPSTTTTTIADGVVTVGQRTLLELEDLARGYRHPCIVDIKIGYRTWYPEAGDEAYIARCKCVSAGPQGGCRHYWACQPWQCLARETLVCSSNPAPLLPLSMANPPPTCCRQKDAATTQARLGFKICGMQVWRSCQGGYWRASKRWCKTLPEALVDKALMSFTNNGEELGSGTVANGH